MRSGRTRHEQERFISLLLTWVRSTESMDGLGTGSIAQSRPFASPQPWSKSILFVPPMQGQQTSPALQGAVQLSAADKERVYQLVYELNQPEKRENALLELSKKRESFPDLAPILWFV